MGFCRSINKHIDEFQEVTTMKPYHDIKNLHFNVEYMIFTINGEEKRIKLKDISGILAGASEVEKKHL